MKRKKLKTIWAANAADPTSTGMKGAICTNPPSGRCRLLPVAKIGNKLVRRGGIV